MWQYIELTTERLMCNLAQITPFTFGDHKSVWDKISPATLKLISALHPSHIGVDGLYLQAQMDCK